MGWWPIGPVGRLACSSWSSPRRERHIGPAQQGILSPRIWNFPGTRSSMTDPTLSVRRRRSGPKHSHLQTQEGCMTSDQEQNLIRSAPYFPVADIKKATEYYHNVLGFVSEYSGGSAAPFRDSQSRWVCHYAAACLKPRPDSSK